MSENETLQNKKSFFADKHNIFSLIAIGSALLAIIFYLVLPVINIGLTPDGKALATLIEDKKMLEYSQTLNGIKVVFGQGTYDVYHNVGSSAVRETQALAFNVPLLIALLLLFVSACGLCFLMVTHKNNIWNKFILAGFIIGTILLLLTAVFFYAVNPIVASTRYNQKLSLYEYGSINAHSGAGMIVALIFGIVASVFSGMLIIRPDDNAR